MRYVESKSYNKKTKKWDLNNVRDGAWWNVFLTNFFWWINEVAMEIAIHFENKLCRHASVSASTSDPRVKCNDCGIVLPKTK